MVNIRESVSLWTLQVISCIWSFYPQPSDHLCINADPILYVINVHKQSTIIFSKSDIFFFPTLLTTNSHTLDFHSIYSNFISKLVPSFLIVSDYQSIIILCLCNFFLNQQFITQRAVADHGSYFITTYKRNRLTRELKLKRKGKRKND